MNILASMSDWSSGEWIAFVTALTGSITSIIIALKANGAATQNARDTKVVAKAASELIDINSANPNTPDVHPTTAAETKNVANP